MTATPVQCQQNRNLPETFNSQTGRSQVMDIPTTQDWLIQNVKHCQRALPTLVVPFGNVLYFEYIATLARLASSKLNQIKNTIFKSKKSLATAQQLVKSHYLSKSHASPSRYRKPFFKQTQRSRVYLSVIPPVLSIHRHNISSNGWISKSALNLQTVSFLLGQAINQTWVQ